MGERSDILKHVGINMPEEEIKKRSIKTGTVNDFDSIETPMTQTLSFVPKEKYDGLEKEKEFFKEKANNEFHRNVSLIEEIEDYKTTIKTLIKIFTK